MCAAITIGATKLGTHEIKCYNVLCSGILHVWRCSQARNQQSKRIVAEPHENAKFEEEYEPHILSNHDPTPDPRVDVTLDLGFGTIKELYQKICSMP